MTIQRVTLLVVAVALAWLAPAIARAAGSPAEIPASDFFRPPVGWDIRLNLDGTHVAMLAQQDDVDSTGLLMLDLETKKKSRLFATKTYNIYSYRWAGNERIVFNVGMNEIYARGLYSIHRDRPDRPLTLFDNEVMVLLGAPSARPENILVWHQSSRDNWGASGPVFELDPRRDPRSKLGNGMLNLKDRIVPPPDRDSLGWMRNLEGEVKYSVSHTNGRLQLLRLSPKRDWIPVGLDIDEYVPIAVDSDPARLLISRFGGHGAFELVRFNSIDGTVGAPLHSDEKYDFGEGRIIASASGKEVIGIEYNRQAPTQIWFREQEAQVQEALDRALPRNRVNIVKGFSRDHTRLLIESSSDRHPGSFYMFDTTKGSLSKILELQPWLPEELMAEVRPISFKTRDGLTLDGYVTLPRDRDASKPAPTIVLPHGGPWVRDVWGFNAEAQFYASRGYVVFQPNYRGSSGYVPSISRDPRADFRAMHNDVTDGTKALIKAGISDPKRIAIVGASFGGYLAVCGAAFEPDLYRCAITFAGVFDWRLFVADARRRGPDSYRYQYYLREIGNPRGQRELFDSMSPINFADRIKVPVFIAHGKEDRTVEVTQSRRLAAELEKRGVPHESFFLNEEGHGFAETRNRVAYFEKVEAFLKENLKEITE